MPEFTITQLIAIAGICTCLPILYLIGSIVRIQAIEELTVAFAEDMPLHRRKELLMQELAEKQAQIESRYTPDKIRRFDAYFYRDGLEEELDFDHLEALDRADFVCIQYLITR